MTRKQNEKRKLSSRPPRGLGGADGRRTRQTHHDAGFNPVMGEFYHGLMVMEIGGWQFTLFNDCDTLDCCEYCRSPNGRVGTASNSAARQN